MIKKERTLFSVKASFFRFFLQTGRYHIIINIGDRQDSPHEPKSEEKSVNVNKRKLRFAALVCLLLLLLTANGCALFPNPPVVNTVETEPTTQQPETTVYTDWFTEPTTQPETIDPNDWFTEPTTRPTEQTVDPLHGSAVRLEGAVLLVSIYAGDSRTSWDFNSAADQEVVNETLTKLDAATRYLTAQAARYQKQVTFYYDWRTYSDLGCSVSFSEDLVRSDTSMYVKQEQWLAATFDVPNLLSRYNAGNIIFLFFFNTDYATQARSWSYTVIPPYFEQRAQGGNEPLEFANFYTKSLNTKMPAASYAHEIMHEFGAHDLYYANRYVPQSYVDHLTATSSSDIMFTVWDSPEVTNVFSDLDAYYVGIAPRPQEADLWGLERSEHELF